MHKGRTPTKIELTTAEKLASAWVHQHGCRQQRKGDLGLHVGDIFLKIDFYHQGISGALVVYQDSNVKVGGWRPTCAQTFFGTPPENSGATENSAENSGSHVKFFLLYVRIDSAAPGLGSRN